MTEFPQISEKHQTTEPRSSEIIKQKKNIPKQHLNIYSNHRKSKTEKSLQRSPGVEEMEIPYL